MSTKNPTPPAELPTGVTRRQTSTGRVFFEAQIRRPTINGKRQSPLSKSFATPEQAAAWRTAELQARNGSAAPASGHTVSSWAKTWLPSTSHLAPATRRSYASLLATHVTPGLGDTRLRDIKLSQLSALYAHVYETRSHATTTRVHAAVLQLLKAATADGHLDTNPASHARLPKRGLQPTATDRKAARTVTAWDARTVNAFLAHVQATDPNFHAFATWPSTPASGAPSCWR